MAGTATKERLVRMLAENRGSYLSGSRIAEQLGITRAAVWKQIRSLMAEGYEIDAVTNRGYCLGDRSDVITKEGLLAALGPEGARYTLEVHDSITSTNTVLKERAESLPDWYVIVSGRQTAGRGRIGRSFYSPEATGIYLSVLLRPDLPAEQSVRITTAAAVAACRAIEETTERKPGIKWVNDVLVPADPSGAYGKAAGILCELTENEHGRYLVIGIGVNVTSAPHVDGANFPPVCLNRPGRPVEPETLCACLTEGFLAAARDGFRFSAVSDEYRARSIVTGRDITFIRNGVSREGTVTAVNGDGSLSVDTEEGPVVLDSGEISVRLR